MAMGLGFWQFLVLCVTAVTLATPRGGQLEVATASAPQQPWAWWCQHRRGKCAQRRRFQRAIVYAQAIPQQPATTGA